MCNSWCLEFVESTYSYWLFNQPNVLEVGSRNVNGSPRSGSPRPESPLKGCASRCGCYTGIDVVAGSEVDIIMDATMLKEHFKPRIFDVVISTEMLEHVRDWTNVLYNMAWVLKPGGWMIITTRSPGFEYHPYPEDHWRFTLEDMSMAFDPAFKIEILTPDKHDVRQGWPYVGLGILAQLRPGISLTSWLLFLQRMRVTSAHIELGKVTTAELLSWLSNS